MRTLTTNETRATAGSIGPSTVALTSAIVLALLFPNKKLGDPGTSYTTTEFVPVLDQYGRQVYDTQGKALADKKVKTYRF